MLNLIDQIISVFSDRKFVFIVGSISTSNLPKQIYNAFKQDSIHLHNFDLDIDLIESPSSVGVVKDKNYILDVVPNSVRIMGNSSFKVDTIFTEQGTLERYLAEIKENGYTLIYFRDEAHIGAESRNTKVKPTLGIFETHMQNAADFILKVTATPELSASSALVEIKESDLREDNLQLLKLHSSYNTNLVANTDYDYIGILNVACKHFIDIKQKYHNDSQLQGVNPAMLIQIESAPSSRDPIEKIQLKNDYDSKIEHIINVLNQHNLTYAYYTSDKKIISIRFKDNWDLYDISDNLSAIDVIIFKVGPATGWNIPRACMLVQLREVCSKALSIQTIGRIKRNPVPNKNLNYNSIANTYFIYSNRDYDITRVEVREATLKKDYEFEKFFIGELIASNSTVSLDSQFWIEYNKMAIKYLNDIFYSNNNFDNVKIAMFFTNHLQQYFSQYENKRCFITKQYRYGAANLIASDNTIRNILDLELYNLDTKRNYQKNITVLIDQYLTNLYQQYISSKDIKAYFNNIGIRNNYSLYKQFFWFIINNLIFPELHQIFNKASKIINNTVSYNLSDTKLLPQKIEIFNCNSQNSIHETDSKFAYEIKNAPIKQFPLDSQPEYIFAKKLLTYLNKHSDVKVWTRNPIRDGINFEYLTDQMQIANSYPDFLVKKGKHTIYIEVKSYLNDINPLKTEHIYNSFKNYISQLEKQRNQKQDIPQISFLIALVEERTIHYAGFSTVTTLNVKLKPNEHVQANEHLHNRIKASYLLDFKDLFI